MIWGAALRIFGSAKWMLAIALALVSTFAWLQTERLSSARETIAARDITIQAHVERIKADFQRLAERDRLIAKQNEAVQAIVKAQAGERAAYLERLAKSDRTAKGYRAQADAILQRTIETQDELERSREALRLIVEVVGKETQP